MTRLWKKTDTKMNPVVEKYTAGSTAIFDMEVMPFDIEASRAHAKGLAKIEILTADELRQIQNSLDSLEKDLKAGKIKITPEDEDCHTVIENYLVEKAGEVGKKIHTGRSRNDQIAVAMRLYMKHHIESVEKSARMLAGQFIDAAEKYKGVPMPGYSHTPGNAYHRGALFRSVRREPFRRRRFAFCSTRAHRQESARDGGRIRQRDTARPGVHEKRTRLCGHSGKFTVR